MKLIDENFVKRNVGPVVVAECKHCSKGIVLRAGSPALTRLISHLVQHGIDITKAIESPGVLGKVSK